ncbi:hypothetical protein GW17_00034347 [Ensete ventricosum]|nr:hypothetical protein GW17_00034347 [Ensete ventricosum]
MRQPLDFFFAVFFAEGRRRLWPSSLSNAADEENLGTPRGGLSDVVEASPHPCREKKTRQPHLLLPFSWLGNLTKLNSTKLEVSLLRSRSEPYSDTEIKVHFSMSLVLIP